MRLKAFLLLFGFIYICSGLAAEANTKAIIKNAMASVVYVINYDQEGREKGQGTGFFINDKGYIVTNVHVVKDAYSVGIKTSDGKKYLLDNVINSDEEADLFIFTVIGFNKNHGVLVPDGQRREVGDSVMVVGNPMGLEQTVSTGIISAVRDEKFELGDLYQITAPISPGSSGSPVLDSEGGVIGVAVLQANEGQNLNFVVPSQKLINLTSRNAALSFDAWKKRGYCYMPETAKGLLSQGYRFYYDEKYAQAQSTTAALLKKYPKYAKGYILAGYVFSGQKKNDLALKYARYALKLEPKLEYANNDLGIIYDEMDLDDLAEPQYLREIALYPKNPNAYCNLAVLYHKQGKYEMAEEVINKALKNSENLSIIHSTFGILLADYGEYQRALEELNTAMEKNQYNPDVYYGKAIVFLRESNMQLALEMHSRLKRLDEKKAAKLYKIIHPE